MSVRQALQSAIRDYAAEARHLPSAQQLVQRLQELSQDIARLPDPMSRGEGSVPKQFEGEGDPTPGQQAAGGVTRVEIHVNTDKPQFPDKQQLLGRMRRGS